MREDRPWRRWVMDLPRDLAEIVALVMTLETFMLRVDHGDIPNDKAERIEVVEAIFAERYVDVMARVMAWVDRNIRDEESTGKVLALLRDRGRSVISGKSGLNKPSQIHIHHVWPKGCFEPGRPEKIHDPSNLATVTREEHEMIHADWRAWVPRLKEAIGEKCSDLSSNRG